MPKIQWDPTTLLLPAPATLVSCGTMENPTMLTVAWTGILSSKPPKTYISLTPARHSFEIIKESREFVINLPTTDIAKSVDFCGVRTGAKTNKFTATGLTPEPASVVAAPMVAECPVSIECRVTDIIDLGSHHMFMADIVKVNVQDTMLDSAGKLLVEKLRLLTYAHGSYFGLSKEIGTFGYSVRKKPRPVRKAEAIDRRRNRG